MSTLNYTISMLGPSRVGKTSLIATIFDMARTELLAGKPFNITPSNNATTKKLAIHARELRSSIDAEDFNAGAVGGTQEPFTFSFDLTNVTNKEQVEQVLNFNILDFPGGWIDNANRPDDKIDEWKKCKSTIIQSSVLIIPVEATVIMEASSSAERGAVEYNLQTQDIKSVIEDWAKQRNALCQNQPSLVIFAPVKCESYFNDNVNKRSTDKSQELFEKTQKYYREVIDAISREFSKASVTMLYSPVDTIGGVEIESGKWQKDDGILRFSGKYHITNFEKPLQPKGGEGIFISLCKTLVVTQQMLDQAKVSESEQVYYDKVAQAERAQRYAEQDEGFWGNLRLWWTDERKKRRSEAAKARNLSEEAKNQYRDQKERAQSVSELVEELAKMELSERTRVIK